MTAPAQALVIVDRATGLEAVLVLDDVTLGPAAGGIRTLPYPTLAAAAEDARRLARAMTLKCALAGLDAGGGKGVVRDHSGLDRTRAFERLGERIEALGGIFRTAGDAGTRRADLEALARGTRYIHTDEGPLADAVGRGLVAAIRATCAVIDLDSWSRLTVAVQGAGAIGSAAARALRAAGVARILVADVEPDRATALALEVDGEAVAPGSLLTAEVDVLAPCALGGVIDERVADQLRARIVCGGANNILATPAAERRLRDRGVCFVPDPITSAGAVIHGIGRSVMGLTLTETDALIDRVGATTQAVLSEALATGELASLVAERLASARIARAQSGGVNRDASPAQQS